MSIADVKNKLPNDFLDMLEEVYSQSERDLIYRSFEKGRYTSFRINTLKGQVPNILKEMKRNKINPIDIIDLPNAFYIKGHVENIIKKLECFKNGEIYMQSISSMIPSILVGSKENIKILDMCAAPGGKSLYIACLLNEKCEIISNEPNDIRREILRHNIIKQGANCIKITPYDGRKISKELNEKFDYILIDAPCSGEGILRVDKKSKNYNWNIKRINNFSKIQKKLIKNALSLIKDNGVIIYSTCTLNPYENEEVIEYFLNSNEVTVCNIEEQIQCSKIAITTFMGKEYNNKISKCIRIIPSEYTEGFFIAKLKKKL
ncbi:MAG: RsmB/NOP family class I SAM-dependent RNA methyltransferase [Clostridium sp.]